MSQQNIKFLNTRDEPSALKLIESAFGYDQNFYYKEDFLPLFDQRFNSHSINAYANENLIGHLGFCFREIIINDSKLPFCFIGAIAVDQAYRGQGLFRSMMDKVLKENINKVAGFLLWSSESKMYEKFGFTECGHIYQWGEEKNTLNFIKLENINDRQLHELKNLYEKTWSSRVHRSLEQWLALKDMKSVEIYVDNIDKVESYFLRSKGFDLKDIIHEFASNSLNSFINDFASSAVWSPIPTQTHFKKLWLGLARQGDLWPKSMASIEDTFNETDIMIGGIDSI